tara:strand:+ start:13174 stop:13935 length:762 start_codon:yes stop_codon:yes gene_type:complete
MELDWKTVCAELAKPFNDEDVFWRVDRSFGNWARVLCYLDARAVMDRLDSVVGPQNWRDVYTETQSGKNICTLFIRVGDDWVSKSDGAGNTNIEGDKGGLSDAFKRAGVKWGIGRHLYSLGETKVNLSEQRPSCEKHYLVVASKRGEKTKYGVAPSIQKIQSHLYPKGIVLESIRNVLRKEKVDVSDIPLILEAATANVVDGKVTIEGIKQCNPNAMEEQRLIELSNRLKLWSNTGQFSKQISDYISAVQGGE